ncbi:hypothetical protein LINGRAHAP2_LOCUS2620 [Linum grandiflorum]
MSHFYWRVLDAPQQFDTFSCGLYVLYFNEHYRSGFTQEQRIQWSRMEVLTADRDHYAYRLISDPTNEEGEYVMEEALAADNPKINALRRKRGAK